MNYLVRRNTSKNTLHRKILSTLGVKNSYVFIRLMLTIFFFEAVCTINSMNSSNRKNKISHEKDV